MDILTMTRMLLKNKKMTRRIKKTRTVVVLYRYLNFQIYILATAARHM